MTVSEAVSRWELECGVFVFPKAEPFVFCQQRHSLIRSHVVVFPHWWGPLTKHTRSQILSMTI